MRSRPLRLLTALLATVMLLGACSDDGGSDDESGTTAETTTTEADDGTTTTESEDEATTTTEAGDEATTTTEGDSGDAAAGGAIDIEALAEIDDFCALNEETQDSEALGAVLGGEVEGPEDLEQAFLFMQAFFARVVEIAPDEIRDDVVTVADGMDAWMGLLADYEFDFTAAGAAAATDPEVAARMEAVNSEEFATASENIDNWIAANCG